MTNPLGVILAGGLSRRMGGDEKSLMQLGAISTIEWVKNNLATQVDDVIVNANGDPERFEFLDLPVIHDTIEGYAGPLAGVLAGMRYAQEHTKHSHIITAAADTPFFPKNYAEMMASSQAEITLASSNARRHPVFGLWPVSLADALEVFLVQEQNRKVMLFVQRYKNAQIEFGNSSKGDDPFFNVNTPDDMKIAEEIAARIL